MKSRWKNKITASLLLINFILQSSRGKNWRENSNILFQQEFDWNRFSNLVWKHQSRNMTELGSILSPSFCNISFLTWSLLTKAKSSFNFIANEKAVEQLWKCSGPGTGRQPESWWRVLPIESLGIKLGRKRRIGLEHITIYRRPIHEWSVNLIYFNCTNCK